jgi:amino acid transporter
MPVPAIVLAVLVFGLLLLNLGNTQIITAVGGLAAVLVYLTYTIVTVSLLCARLRREWPTPDHGPYFNMGRWGLPANVVAVVFQLFMIVNLAWPRPEIYGTGAWYLTWAGVLFSGLIVLAGVLYYVLAHHRPGTLAALAEHRARTGEDAENSLETPDLTTR